MGKNWLGTIITTIAAIVMTVVAIYFPLAWPLAIGLWVSALASAVLTLIAPDPDTPQMNQQQGLLANVCSTQEPLKVIYGKCRVGINRVFVRTAGDENKSLIVVGNLCEGEAEGIDVVDGVPQIFLDDKLYNQYGVSFYYEFYSGSSTQNVSAWLQSYAPEWNEAKRHTCYIILCIQFDKDKFQSLPNITVTMKGTKVGVPSLTTSLTGTQTLAQTHITASDGSASIKLDGVDLSGEVGKKVTITDQAGKTLVGWALSVYDTTGLYIRSDDYGYGKMWGTKEADFNYVDPGGYTYLTQSVTWTPTWSQNPAYCSRDLLIRSRKRGGYGMNPAKIPYTLVKEAADYCDLVGWKCDGALLGQYSIIDHVKMLLNTFRGVLFYSESVWKMKFKDLNYESTVMDFDDSDIMMVGGKSSLEVESGDIFDMPNAVRMKYYPREKNYIPDDYVKAEQALVTASGSYREEVIDCTMVTDKENVIKMAAYWLERLQKDTKTTFLTGHKVLVLEPNDLVRTTFSRLGWVDKIHRVESIGVTQEMNFAPGLVEEYLELYDNTYNMESYSQPSVPWIDPWTTIPPVRNVTHQEISYEYGDRTFTKWQINFDLPDPASYPFAKWVNVWVKRGLGDYLFQAKADSNFVIDPVQEGETYYVKLQVYTVFETTQPLGDAIAISHLMQGKTTLPSNLGSITGVATGDVVNLFGSSLNEADIVGYEVRWGIAWTGGIFRGLYPSAQISIPGVRPGTFNFYIAAKDNRGRYSEVKSNAEVTVLYPANYVDKNSWSWDFTSGTCTNTEHVTHNAQDALKCSHTGGVLSGTFLSPEYNLGSVKTVRVWGGFLYDYVSSATTWGGVFSAGALWNSVDMTKSWNQIFSPDSGSQLRATLKYGTVSGDLTNEIDFFELIAPEITAQYLQVEITITDPTLDANLYLYELNMKAAYWN